MFGTARMKKLWILIIVAVFLLGIAVYFGLTGGGWGHGQKWVHLPFQPGDSAGLPAAKTPDGSPLTLAAVAGGYRTASSGTRSIFISPDGECECWWGGSVSSISSRAVARIVEGRIEIESRNLLGIRNGETCVCIPVWWQDKVYLLGSPGDPYSGGGIVEFCNAINWGDEPAPRGFRSRDLVFARATDGPGTRTGIPEAVKKRILLAPLEGKIVSASPALRANLGTKDGVYVGMRLHAPRGDDYARWLRVTSVDEGSCSLERYSVDDNQASPAVGSRVICEARGAEVLSRK